MTRPSWDSYFLQIAKVVSSRSTCFRTQCGAVVVRDKKIISTGYNGSPKYQQNCEEIGFCYRNMFNIKSGTSLELCRAVGSHAESNAIALASKQGTSTDNATIYIFGNTDICYQCRGIIVNAGIIRAVHLTKDDKLIEHTPSKEWLIHPIDKNIEFFSMKEVYHNLTNLIKRDRQFDFDFAIVKINNEEKEIKFDEMQVYNIEKGEINFLYKQENKIYCNINDIIQIFGESWRDKSNEFKLYFLNILKNNKRD